MFETETLPRHGYQDTLQSYSVTINVYYAWPASTDTANCHWFMPSWLWLSTHSI